MIKLSDYVFSFISDLGIKHVFMVTGGGCMHLVDSLGKNKNLKYISCHHEQAVAIAADAYSQFNNMLGVGLVTTGPGGTNAITGVMSSWVDSIPVLIISGQVKRSDMTNDLNVRMLGFQEVNITSIVEKFTKYSITITEPETIKFHLEKAVYLASSGRKGPVWIDIPLDVQASLIDENNLKGFTIPCDDNLKIDNGIKTKANEICELIKKAKRPVILAGNGIRLSNAENIFLKLIEKLKIPVLLTWKLADVMPYDHEFFFGRPGAIGQRGANFIQQNSDLIIVIGARLDPGQIGYSYENFVRGGKKVVVDIDSAEINKLKFDIDVAVISDALTFITELLNQVKKENIPDYDDWIIKCRQLNEKYPVVLNEYKLQDKYLSTYALIDLICSKLTSSDVIVPGSSGACSDILYQTLKNKKGQRVINSTSLGSMGFGVPAAIGACFSSGNRRTINFN